MTKFHTIPAAMIALASFASAQAQIAGGLTSDFTDGTLQGWEVGAAGAQPTVVGGGPDGLFLRSVSVGGNGPNSAQLIQNRTIWTGNYIAAGITEIRAMVRVATTSAGPLHLRLSFTNVISGTGGTGYSSAEAVVVPNDGQFHEVVWPVSPAALALVPNTGTASFETVMSSVAGIRILAAASGPSYIVAVPDRLASTMDIDSIVAVTTPPGPAGCTVADIADGFGQTIADGGGPDGVLDVSDLFAYLGAFELGILSVADIADGFGQTIENGAGPDGNLDVSDLFAFLDDFAAINPDCL